MVIKCFSFKGSYYWVESEACPGDFSSGEDSIFRGGGKKNTKKERGAEYLIITKERLVLASDPYESYFHQGQRHTIRNSSGAYTEGDISPTIRQVDLLDITILY